MHFLLRLSVVLLNMVTPVGGVFAQPPTDAARLSLAERLAPVLANLASGIRDDAIRRGVQPIPEPIRAVLEGYIPAEVLDSVRWRIDGDTGAIGRSLFTLSSAYAVTLDNVILFAGADEAADTGIWAHEVFHVMQYREWGVHGFMQRYISDYRAVENEAKEFRYQWKTASDEVRTAQ